MCNVCRSLFVLLSYGYSGIQHILTIWVSWRDSYKRWGRHGRDHAVVGFTNIHTIKVFSGVRVTRSLVLCVMSVDRCLSFCPLSFHLCVVCPSIYRLWLPLWYLQTLLSIYLIKRSSNTNPTKNRGWILLVRTFQMPNKCYNPVHVTEIHICITCPSYLFQGSIMSY
jgi:hypothetical protein